MDQLIKTNLKKLSHVKNLFYQLPKMVSVKELLITILELQVEVVKELSVLSTLHEMATCLRLFQLMKEIKYLFLQIKVELSDAQLKKLELLVETHKELELLNYLEKKKLFLQLKLMII